VLSYRYDLVFLQKGLGTINYRGFHRLLYFFNKNIIFDFDDAITIGRISSFRKFPLNLLEDKQQVFKVSKLAKKVIVGNEALKNDIVSFNSNVIVIPTPVDTTYYSLEKNRYEPKKRLNILWSGNKSGHIYLKICSTALKELCKKYPVDIMVLSDDFDNRLKEILPEIEINFFPWSIENEKKAFSCADIGIMPLYDTLWDRRKCAFKALMYMACGIPAVSSPVGVARNIICDGENGLFAETNNEWFNKLSLLVNDNNLRMKIGLAGRRSVEDNFSLSKWGPVWKEVLKNR
jgi:glycosyltransferase involved in cell wall biosynthesis